MFRRTAFAAAALAAVAMLPSGPAAAQSRDFCVARLPFPPVPPATQSKLVVNQAYLVPHVGANSTEFWVHAQLQNQSSGTIKLVVNTANLTAPSGGRWFTDHQTVTMTSYQPVDVVIAKLTVPGRTNTLPGLDAWNIVSRLVQSCPVSR